jgi:hypothetical protein
MTTRISPKTKVSFEVTFTLTEAEARAIHALASYDEQQVMNAFLEKFGRSVVDTHRAGWTRFFETVRTELRQELLVVDNARLILTRPEPPSGSRP